MLVNRVWQWHFGKGLVTTPSDFGVRSDPPSHPELLDYLASEFIASGWSIKSLHRRIMLSSTYQQRSEPRPTPSWNATPRTGSYGGSTASGSISRRCATRFWRFPGALNPTIGGPSTPITERPFSTRRTVYGFIDRQNLDGLYRTFDFAVPDATSPRRFVTTVPQQALFLMNSPFLHEQARRLAAVVRPRRRRWPGGFVSSPADSCTDPADGVRRLYFRALGRPPQADELALGNRVCPASDRAQTRPTGKWKAVQPRERRACSLSVGAVGPGLVIDE